MFEVGDSVLYGHPDGTIERGRVKGHVRDGMSNTMYVTADLEKGGDVMAQEYRFWPVVERPIPTPKPGTRARVVKGPFAGRVGSVAGIGVDPGGPYVEIHLDAEDGAFQVAEFRLGEFEITAPAKATPAFKAGDRVTIYHPQFPGHTGTLVAAVTRWDGERIWTVDRPRGKPIPVPENMLRLLGDPEPTKAARTWPTNDTADAIGGRSVEALSIFYNAEGGVVGVVFRDRSRCDATAHPSATIAWLAKGLRGMVNEHFSELPDEPTA